MGMVSDNPDQKINLKIFHGEILNNHEGIRKEEDGYLEIPVVREIESKVIHENYLRIKKDIVKIVCEASVIKELNEL